MAFPIIAGETTSVQNTDVESHTVNLPAGIVAGEIVLVVMTIDDIPTVTWPAGWISLVSAPTATAVRQEVRYQIAAVDVPGASSITVLTTGSPQRSAHRSFRIQNGGTPTAATGVGSTVSPDPPSLTRGAVAKDMLWLAFASNSQGGFTAYPTNYTKADGSPGGESIVGGTSGSSAGWATLASARRFTTAFSEDPGVFTATNTNWVASTIGFHDQTLRAEVKTPGTLLDVLISWWDLEEVSGQRIDAHGTNHLADNNTVTQAAGKVGQAAQFTKANSEYLSIPSNASVGVGGQNTPFTLAGWVWLDTLEYFIFASKINGTSDFEYSMHYNQVGDSTFGFGVGDPGGLGAGNNIHTGTATTAGWYFLLGSTNPAVEQISFRVNNGTVVQINSWPGDPLGPPASSGQFRLGAKDHTSPTYHNGRLDSWALWKRLLTSAEQTWLYNSGNGRRYLELFTYPSSISSGSATVASATNIAASGGSQSGPGTATANAFLIPQAAAQGSSRSSGKVLPPDVAFVDMGTAAQNAAIGGNLTLSLPAGTKTGDVLLALINADDLDLIPPSGWALLKFQFYGGPGGNGNHSLHVFWKRRIDGEPANWTWTGIVNRGGGIVVAYRNTADAPVSPFTGVVASGGNGTDVGTTTPVAPTITTTQRGMLLALFGTRRVAGNVAQTTAPTGMTERYDQQVDTNLRAALHLNEQMLDAGATGTRTATLDLQPDGNTFMTFALSNYIEIHQGASASSGSASPIISTLKVGATGASASSGQVAGNVLRLAEASGSSTSVRAASSADASVLTIPPVLVQAAGNSTSVGTADAALVRDIAATGASTSEGSAAVTIALTAEATGTSTSGPGTATANTFLIPQAAAQGNSASSGTATATMLFLVTSASGASVSLGSSEAVGFFQLISPASIVSLESVGTPYLFFPVVVSANTDTMVFSDIAPTVLTPTLLATSSVDDSQATIMVFSSYAILNVIVPPAPIPAGLNFVNIKRISATMPVPVLDSKGRPT